MIILTLTISKSAAMLLENDILVKSFYPAGKDNYILSINDESFYIMELD